MPDEPGKDLSQFSIASLRTSSGVFSWAFATDHRLARCSELNEGLQ
jgi:hypothetical protein